MMGRSLRAGTHPDSAPTSSAVPLGTEYGATTSVMPTLYLSPTTLHCSVATVTQASQTADPHSGDVGNSVYIGLTS